MTTYPDLGPNGPVDDHIRNACPNCGGGTGGFMKTGRNPDHDYHAEWCPTIRARTQPAPHGPTVRSNTADEHQHDADIYDDHQHGCTIDTIARAEGITPHAVHAAINRHRRRTQ